MKKQYVEPSYNVCEVEETQFNIMASIPEHPHRPNDDHRPEDDDHHNPQDWNHKNYNVWNNEW